MALTMEGLAKALNAKIKSKDESKKNKKKKRNASELSISTPVDIEAERKRKRREREKKKRQKRKKKAQVQAQAASSQQSAAEQLSNAASSSKTQPSKIRTVSIALPGSIVDNCQSRELQSYVAGYFFFKSLILIQFSIT